MTRRYFKITGFKDSNPLKAEHGTPIEALKAHMRKKQAFHRAAYDFAKLFNAEPVIATSYSEGYVHGVSGELENPDLWRKPDPKARYSTQPRAKGARNVKGPEMKALHAELLEKWKANLPDRVSLDEQWLPAGYATMDLFIGGGGMAVDYEGGLIYVSAGQEPERGVDFEEIVGGEYLRIEAVSKEQKTEDYL